MWNIVLNFLIIIIPVLVNVAFFTLLERKFLGFSQLRKGPNKVSFFGILQPISDAVKLFSKEMFVPGTSNMYFFFSPMISFFLVLIFTCLMVFKEFYLSNKFSVIFLILVLSMNIYPMFSCGWSSNSKYAFLGAMRGVVQTISYEISMAILILTFLSLNHSLEMKNLFFFNNYIFWMWMSLPSLFMLLITCVAETNRTPFDFSEGESELVSGFNIEYASGVFAMIFMAEYASIMVMSIFLTLLMFSTSFSNLLSNLVALVMMLIWIWFRTTFPRYRYDKLMNLAWKVILPSSLTMLIFFFSLSIF